MMADDALLFQALRESMGLTQSAVADMLHVKQASVSRWETGRVAIPARATDLITVLAGSVHGVYENFVNEGAATGRIALSRDGSRVLWECPQDVRVTLERVAAARAWATLTVRDDTPDCTITTEE